MRSFFDAERLRHVLQVQYQVVTRRQALLCGMPHSTLDRQIAPGGPWQRLLPGVYLTVTGTVTRDQREMAALLYAGPRSDVRHVVCAVVQQRACTVAELTEELQAGPPAGATLFRAALAEIGDGVRSVAEGDLRVLILGSDLPKPMFNARLFEANGVFIATVDDCWQDAGVAGEVDSRAYHLSVDDQDRTTERHGRLIAHGIFPLHFSPRRIKTDPAAIIRDLRSAIDAARRRPPLPITALPAAG